MRTICSILSALMLVFAAVQYNDPDGPFWMVIYGFVAIACGIAAFRPTLYWRPIPMAFVTACLVGGVIGSVYYFPHQEAWWTIDVWWPEDGETSREGMGMMIGTVALVFAFLVARRAFRGGYGAEEAQLGLG